MYVPAKLEPNTEFSENIFSSKIGTFVQSPLNPVRGMEISQQFFAPLSRIYPSIKKPFVNTEAISSSCDGSSSTWIFSVKLSPAPIVLRDDRSAVQSRATAPDITVPSSELPTSSVVRTSSAFLNLTVSPLMFFMLTFISKLSFILSYSSILASPLSPVRITLSSRRFERLTKPAPCLLGVI